MDIETWDEEDRDVVAEVDYSPPGDDVPYLPNGDPGYPGHPEECRILAATVDGEEVDPAELDAATVERIRDAAACEWDDAPDYPEPEDEPDGF